MKLFSAIKYTVFAFVLLLSSLTGFGQETEGQQAVSVTYDRPLYEQFGMSSTELFMLMMFVTLVLLIVLLGISFNLKHVLDYKLKKGKDKVIKVVLVLIGLFAFGNQSFAQSDTFEQAEFRVPFPDEAFWLLLGLDIVMLMIILYMVGIMNGILYQFVPPRKWKIWARFQRKLTDAKPVEEEADILMDHDYDGIKELDNNLPPWWKWGFYITIVWSVGYLGWYHVLGGRSQEDEYLQEMEEGERAVAEYRAQHPELVTIDNVQFVTDDANLSKGRSIFNEFCVTCHMEGGAGGAGPNLTDEFWIYEGDIKGVFNTIAEGANNGMKAWKNQLNGAQIQAVASYVLQLDPILPPQGQEPKGDKHYPRMPK